MRERRVPGDVDVAGEQLLDLPLVIRKEREVERRALLAKIFANAFPYRDDFRIVRNGSEQNRLIHSILLKQRQPGQHAR